MADDPVVLCLKCGARRYIRISPGGVGMSTPDTVRRTMRRNCKQDGRPKPCDLQYRCGIDRAGIMEAMREAARRNGD